MQRVYYNRSLRAVDRFDSNYMMRRRWDFFVKWLMGTEPPKEHELKP